jgi:hypothetical protein
MMIEAGGSLLGAIGVSGAPGGREDDAVRGGGHRRDPRGNRAVTNRGIIAA